MILMNSLVDYFKDKKFIQLRSFLINDMVTVTRGKFGATEQISMWDVVVGDIINVSQG
jgi:magnesium-transporting ATPase (P-type)